MAPKAAAGAAPVGDDNDDEKGFAQGRFGRRPVYMYNGKRCQGLHRFLKTRFWSKDVTPWGQRRHKAPQTAPIIGDEGRQHWMSPIQLATARGIATDRQIKYWVENKGEMPSDANQFTRTFIEWCNDAEMTGVVSQDLVGVAKARIATARDVVLRSKKTGKAWLIQIKTDTTGRESFEDSGGLMMRGALKDVPCSRANMAKLQATVERWMSEETHPDEKLEGAYVLRLGRMRHDVTAYRLRDEWLTRGLDAVKKAAFKRAEKHTEKAEKAAAAKVAKAAAKAIAKAEKAAAKAATKAAAVGAKRKAAAAAAATAAATAKPAKKKQKK